jgi:D-alanine-D-alanine ligase-like ATP-grasp enzyme
LKQLGYEVIEQDCGPTLFERVRKDHPAVVFNLSSIYGWEKTDLTPAVLEVVGIPYTGSGMLSLSLARNYTKLFPLLQNSGIQVPSFHVVETGDPIPLSQLEYPVRMYRDSEKYTLFLNNEVELGRIIKKLPVHEKILLMKPLSGKRVSLFIMDNMPFLKTLDSSYLIPAQKAYHILEARGLARFDFIVSGKPILVNVEIAPDPLDEELIQEAGLAGWDERRLLQTIIDHAANDLQYGFQQSY